MSRGHGEKRGIVILERRAAVLELQRKNIRSSGITLEGFLRAARFETPAVISFQIQRPHIDQPASTTSPKTVCHTHTGGLFSRLVFGILRSC